MEMLATILALLAVVLAAAVIVLAVLLRRAQEGRHIQDARTAEDLARANGALDAANGALDGLAAALSGISVQMSSGAAVSQQRYEGLVREYGRSAVRSDELRREVLDRLDRSRADSEVRLDKMRDTLDRQLDAIRATVDERLARTLNDRLGASFKQVSDQLEAVYKGLGEMRDVAGGVKDLKRVLSNVKTRGMLGEVQLGAILADILAPDQYAENVATKPGSAERVEFAVKLPVRDGEPVWLPIDAKFPGTTYEHLRDAVDAGDAEGIATARKALDQVIRQEARDISEKYLSVPETTGFGIMFLPFEGLYAEVVDRPGLIEGLQRDFQVNVAGPSTMAAILNSLQMSYQTFAFQRQADEIQKVLSAVKAEFPKYQAELRRALKQIETAGRTVDGIINTRTSVIERKLRGVTALEDDVASARLLGFDTIGETLDGGNEEVG